MAKEYGVLDIRELPVVGDTGGIERLFRVRIKTTGGTGLTVDLSMDEFDEEKAAPILKAAAVKADKVLAL